jgi:methylphosphotriester-DNA--protein-cysteine methyltransferase
LFHLVFQIYFRRIANTAAVKDKDQTAAIRTEKRLIELQRNQASMLNMAQALQMDQSVMRDFLSKTSSIKPSTSMLAAAVSGSGAVTGTVNKP